MNTKQGNKYAQQFGGEYERIPKAVFAAVALSFAARYCRGDLGGGTLHFLAEWQVLHENGIIPQIPVAGLLLKENV